MRKNRSHTSYLATPAGTCRVRARRALKAVLGNFTSLSLDRSAKTGHSARGTEGVQMATRLRTRLLSGSVRRASSKTALGQLRDVVVSGVNSHAARTVHDEAARSAYHALPQRLSFFFFFTWQRPFCLFLFEERACLWCRYCAEPLFRKEWKMIRCAMCGTVKFPEWRYRYIHIYIYTCRESPQCCLTLTLSTLRCPLGSFQ